MLDKKTTLVIIFVSLLAIIGFVVFYLSRSAATPAKIQLLGVSPAPDTTETSLLPKISLTFKQKVSPEQFSLSSVPAFPYKVLTEKENTVIEYLPDKLLEKKTTYHLLIQFKNGADYSWGFTTGEVEAGALPGWAEDSKKIQEEYYREYPPEEVEILNLIIEQMPYYEADFWIEYSARRQTFTVHLCQALYEETRKKAEEWFSQQGLNKVIRLALKIEWFEGCEPPLKR